MTQPIHRYMKTTWEKMTEDQWVSPRVIGSIDCFLQVQNISQDTLYIINTLYNRQYNARDRVILVVDDERLTHEATDGWVTQDESTTKLQRSSILSGNNVNTSQVLNAIFRMFEWPLNREIDGHSIEGIPPESDKTSDTDIPIISTHRNQYENPFQ